jgi:hypothetical protein
MQYVRSLGWIGVAAVSRGYVGSKGHKSTDKRSMKHRDSYDRERHAKRMEIPQQAFEEDKRKAESVRAERAAKSRPTPETDKDREGEGRYSELQRSSAKRK